MTGAYVWVGVKPMTLEDEGRAGCRVQGECDVPVGLEEFEHDVTGIDGTVRGNDGGLFDEMGVDEVHGDLVMRPVGDLCAHLGITPRPVFLLG